MKLKDLASGSKRLVVSRAYNSADPAHGEIIDMALALNKERGYTMSEIVDAAMNALHKDLTGGHTVSHTLSADYITSQMVDHIKRMQAISADISAMLVDIASGVIVSPERINNVNQQLRDAAQFTTLEGADAFGGGITELDDNEIIEW